MKIKSKTRKYAPNISSTFFNRCVCKFCGKGPGKVGVRYKHLAHSLSIDDMLKVGLKLREDGFYRRPIRNNSQPRLFTIKDFSFDDKYSVCFASVHKSRVIANHTHDFGEYMCCPCHRTCWLFDNRSVSNRPEITNRKGRYSYPNKLM